MKNKILIVILVLLMLSPSLVAIINYNLQQFGSADSHNTVSVKVTDPDGDVFEFNRDGGKEMMKYFLDTIARAENIGTLPSTVELSDFYRVVLTTAVKDFGYKFFYSTTTTDCYFSDDSGVAFKIKENDAKDFITGKYSAALYENGKAPKLTVSGQDCIADEAAWSYKDIDGEYIKADTSFSVKKEVEKLSLEGGFAMGFPITPDSFAVKITDENGNVIFNDEYAKIAELTITEKQNVQVEATAKWYEDSERTYYGEESYSFKAQISAPAQFYAGTTQIQAGEFILVTGVNVGAADKITFTSTPDIGYTPTFYKNGDNAYALIPFNWDLTEGEYTLDFSYGGSNQPIKIIVGKRDNPFRDNGTVTIAQAVVTSFGTDEARTKAETEFSEIAKAGDAKQYWEGSFGTGAGNSTITSGYGHTYSVNGGVTSYRHTGVDYRMEANSDVTAVNNGKVVYAGYTDYSGYTVVIEHGYGLKSWYAHLASTSVEVGAEVKKGDTLGVSGSSGFVASSGCHVGITVFDVPVCQYALWDDGSRKGIPAYEAN